MQEIKKALFVKSSAQMADCPEPNLPEYAFIGRSNVGKSSLINLLTQQNHLAKISTKPGKTQLINHFLIDEAWYLVDLPGYGWAKVSKTEKAKWKKMVNEYFEQRQNLYNVFLLVDSRHEPLQIDLEFMQWLGENGIPFSIVFTKTDKQGKTKTQQNLAAYKRVLRKQWDELPPIFATSTVTGEGKSDLLQYIRDINNSVKN
ncbi:MAG: ribosome biogenesis GTP-binding protein YihA/YsxC [Cyclobacteriaceae bacterium]|nr:ribosome biogenesis GTP-binding protein YihA/YsxC [Cyclobacteriaceae bacterium]